MAMAVEWEDLQDSWHDEEDGTQFDSGSGSRDSNINAKGDAEHLTKAETRLVNRGKLLVYVVLTIAAVVVASLAFVFLKKEEEQTMEVEFSAYSREILKQAQANALIMFEELMEMSKSITSHTLDSEMTWPNVTLPHFDVRAHRSKDFTLEFSGFAPFVTPATRDGWEHYALQNQEWIAQDYHYRGWNHTPAPIPSQIHRYNESAPVTDFDNDMFDYEMPLWQLSPARKDNYSIVNLDLSSVPVFAHLLWDIKVKKVEQYSRIMDLKFLLGDNIPNPHHPRGTIYQPVFEDFTEQAEVVGFMIGTLTWDYMFQNVLFGSSAPLLVEIEGTCNAKFTYKITGKQFVFLGYGEGWRDTRFDRFKQSADLLAPKGSRPGYPPVKHKHRSSDASHGDSHCTYQMNTYPTEEFQSQYSSWAPTIMAVAIGAVFAFTAMIFLLYDYLVARRQNKLLTTATRTNAIVSSLFPKEVRQRMMEEQAEPKAPAEKGRFLGKRSGMSAFLNDGNMGANNDVNSGGAPIADLFPSATIMFADICGFTAWSSAREPSQVFTLLETLYGAFDKIARKRRVFKVETIGDCYVAVCGLPEERANHATIMARFARDCLHSMEVQLRSLETSLGPDTCDLGMRTGLHSGPVTAGVLRGERARFQLFGDSVNTCARIETTGQRNRIHLSQETADLLVAHGKQHWIEKRHDEVEAKGKGKLSTFWLTKMDGDGLGGSKDDYTSADNTETLRNDDLETGAINLSAKDKRLVDWHVSMLSKLLQQIHARRESIKEKKDRNMADLEALEGHIGSGKSAALDEVEEIINFPIFTAQTCRDYSVEAEAVVLSGEVVSELRSFISEIASTYHSNPFHNFDHASHVTMSVCKLLSRIVAPSENDPGVDHGYGITSDPLTQFAVVLSAIIHDADHPGVPNSQMIKEGSSLASIFDNKSIAEQNSFQLSWEKLMGPSYANLRAAIYSNEEELKRFRQLLVNSVMATDIMDKNLGAARKNRWNKAFSEQTPVDESPDAVINRKATIVIEHLIQASDVAHTQQHWHIFSKWNERLFMEMYKAYRSGRAEKDPSIGWYNGELGFFDFYIIPLAKKLKDCGVFGVSSDEYLNYAQTNRAEWEAKGQSQVKMYLEKFENEFGSQFDAPSNNYASFSSLGSVASLISNRLDTNEAPTESSSSSSSTPLLPSISKTRNQQAASKSIDVDDWAASSPTTSLYSPLFESSPQLSQPPSFGKPPMERRASRDYRQFLAGRDGRTGSTRDSYQKVSVKCSEVFDEKVGQPMWQILPETDIELSDCCSC